MRAIRLAALAILASALGAGAQSLPWDLRAGLPVGSEEERYLRVLQMTGQAPHRQWTIRSPLSVEVDDVAPTARSHPWAGRFNDVRGERLWYAGLVRPEAKVIFNSALPYGENDGPLWAGKGLTAALSVGAYAGVGPLRVRVAPDLFVTQNSPFELTPNGQSGPAALRDARYPTQIDHPQRFGEDSYGRLDPGGSSIVLDLWPVRVGASTASQQWGPAVRYSLLLGNNAGGFTHLFLETTRGLDLWLFRLHSRFLVARLDQSELSPRRSGELRRFASAVVVGIEPRGVQGLEVGGSRLAVSPWPEDGVDLERTLRPFSGIFTFARGQDAGPNVLLENQLAVAFVRWAPPEGGIEIYAEFLKDDFGRDVRHYLAEIDDLSARVFGIQKVVSLPRKRLLNVRGEVVSAEFPHAERGDRFFRDPVPHPWARYRHDEVEQGHTQRGQILGSPAAYGGAGLTLGVDLYHPGGRWTVELRRTHRLDWHPGYTSEAPDFADVLYAVHFDALLFRNGWDVTASLAPAWNLNRNLVDGRDVFNVNLALGVRGLPW